jgi:hypothetical protein
VSFYCIDYTFQPTIHDGIQPIIGQGGNQGQFMNGTDAADFGSWSPFTNVLTGGQLSESSYTITAGDTIKPIVGWGQPEAGLDQLSDGTKWYNIIGPIDNSGFNKTFYLQCPTDHAVDATCPTPGAAFTGFTRGGVPVVNEMGYDEPKYRLQYDPGPGQGYADPNYVQYGGQTINGLHILGHSVPNAMSDFNARAGTGYYQSGLPSNWWDPSVVIPGLPTPHNGL